MIYRGGDHKFPYIERVKGLCLTDCRTLPPLFRRWEALGPLRIHQHHSWPENPKQHPVPWNLSRSPRCNLWIVNITKKIDTQRAETVLPRLPVRFSCKKKNVVFFKRLIFSLFNCKKLLGSCAVYIQTAVKCKQYTVCLSFGFAPLWLASA